MKILRFLFSTSVLKHLVFIVLATFSIFLLISISLKIITNHNSYQKVPDLEGVPLTDLPGIMEQENLRYEVIDSGRFVPK